MEPRDLLPPPPWEGPPLPRILLERRFPAGNGFSNGLVRPHFTRIGNPVRIHTDVPEPMKPIKIPMWPSRIPMPVWPTREPVPVRR